MMCARCKQAWRLVLALSLLASCAMRIASAAPSPAPGPSPQVQYQSPPPAHAGRYYFDPVDPAFFANITRPTKQNYNSTQFIDANSSSINPVKVAPSNGTFVLNGTAVGSPPAPAPSGSGAGVESALPDGEHSVKLLILLWSWTS